MKIVYKSNINSFTLAQKRLFIRDLIELKRIIICSPNTLILQRIETCCQKYNARLFSPKAYAWYYLYLYSILSDGHQGWSSTFYQMHVYHIVICLFTSWQKKQEMLKMINQYWVDKFNSWCIRRMGNFQEVIHCITYYKSGIATDTKCPSL